MLTQNTKSFKHRGQKRNTGVGTFKRLCSTFTYFCSVELLWKREISKSISVETLRKRNMIVKTRLGWLRDRERWVEPGCQWEVEGVATACLSVGGSAERDKVKMRRPAPTLPHTSSSTDNLAKDSSDRYCLSYAVLSNSCLSENP